MKFFSVFLLTLPIALATPIANPQFGDSVDDTCYSKYCIDYANVSYDCAKKNNLDITKLSDTMEGWNLYLKCFCVDDNLALFKQCVACYKTDTSFADSHDIVCNGGSSTGTDDDTTTDDTTTKDDTTTGTGEKKNDAGTLKSSTGLRMAGAMAIAGGVIAAM